MDIFKKIMAFFCTVISFLFGDIDGMLMALAALIVLDYISGVIAAVIEKRLSSAVGARGIAKKVFMLLIVALANIIDINVIGGHTLRTVTVNIPYGHTHQSSYFSIQKACSLLLL